MQLKIWNIVDGGTHGRKAGGSICGPEEIVLDHFSALYHDLVWTFGQVWHWWKRFQYRLVSLDHWSLATGVFGGKYFIRFKVRKHFKFNVFSITSKYKSTAALWRAFFSHPIWIHIFWTFSNSLLPLSPRMDFFEWHNVFFHENRVWQFFFWVLGFLL